MEGEYARKVTALRLEPNSEQAVDERSERGTLGRHQDPTQEEQEEDDGNQPPFLAKFQKAPKLFDDGQFVHGETGILNVSNSR